MQFKAEIRENFGSLSTKALRKNALVPGSVYNGDGTVSHFSFSEKEITKAVENYKFLNTCFAVDAGKKSINVLPKSVDFHPVTDKVLHVEFKEVPAKGRVQVLVPIVIENRAKSVGIKAGGKLNIPNHNILIECDPKNIPENIAIDVANFGIGRVIFTRHLKTDSSYSFPKDTFVLSVLGRGRKDKGEVGEESSES